MLRMTKTLVEITKEVTALGNTMKRHGPKIQAAAVRSTDQRLRVLLSSGKQIDQHAQRMDKLELVPIMVRNVDEGDFFKALAERTRRAILDELAERNGQTLFELCARLVMRHGIGSSRQAISQHLDVLEAAGLVRTRREGRYKFHDLDTTPLRRLTQRWPTGD
jgi:DNA-binding transcriptional ArsR family regulator